MNLTTFAQMHRNKKEDHSNRLILDANAFVLLSYQEIRETPVHMEHLSVFYSILNVTYIAPASSSLRQRTGWLVAIKTFIYEIYCAQQGHSDNFKKMKATESETRNNSSATRKVESNAFKAALQVPIENSQRFPQICAKRHLLVTSTVKRGKFTAGYPNCWLEMIPNRKDNSH